jgi:putative resolvase
MPGEADRTDELFVDSSEVARRMGVDRDTVGRWIRLGQVRAIRTPGGRWRIPRSELDRLLRGDPPPTG